MIWTFDLRTTCPLGERVYFLHTIVTSLDQTLLDETIQPLFEFIVPTLEPTDLGDEFTHNSVETQLLPSVEADKDS